MHVFALSPIFLLRTTFRNQIKISWNCDLSYHFRNPRVKDYKKKVGMSFSHRKIRAERKKAFSSWLRNYCQRADLGILPNRHVFLASERDQGNHILRNCNFIKAFLLLSNLQVSKIFIDVHSSHRQTENAAKNICIVRTLGGIGSKYSGVFLVLANGERGKIPHLQSFLLCCCSRQCLRAVKC